MKYLTSTKFTFHFLSNLTKLYIFIVDTLNLITTIQSLFSGAYCSSHFCSVMFLIQFI